MKKERMTIRLTREQREKLEIFARTRGISASAAAVELIELGHDSALAGADTRAAQDERLRQELAALRALAAEAIFASDTTTKLVLELFDEDLDPIREFLEARRWAKAQARKLKGQA